MRLCRLAVAITVGGLVACTTVGSSTAPPIDSREEFEHCALESDTWQLIAPPSDAKTILALPMEKGALDNELQPAEASAAIHEHWFSSGDSRIATCRHLPVHDS